jgi:pilus assembly protein FimV
VHKLSAQQRPARKLLGAIVAAALFLPDTGYTLGLGEIEVNSALNQKLNADIELLSATPEEADTLIVKLASRKEFSRAGLDRPFLLNDLIFKSVEINGSSYIKVSSGSPIREPFLNFLVEIDWPNGRLLREYTVLLDPPVFMAQPTSTASTNISSVSNDSGFRPASGGGNNITPVVTSGLSVSSRPVPTAQVAPASAPVTQSQSGAVRQTSRTSPPAFTQPQQRAAINQAAGSYKIKAGDTAWKLAAAMRPDQSVTVTQMMIAMLQENPESFINENINGLKRGYVLRVPDYGQITSISHADAVALVREQAALWQQYRQLKASGQPASAMQTGNANAVVNMAEDSATGREGEASLEIVSAGSGSSTKSGKDPVEMTAQELRTELALARERVETELVEKEALQQRVEALQHNVEKMKGMLAIEDAELAQVPSLMSRKDGISQRAMDGGAINMAESIAADAVIDEPVMEDTDVNAVDEAIDKNVADMSAEAVLDEADALDEIDEAAVLATLENDEVAEIAEEAGEAALFVDEMQVDQALAEDESMAELPEQVASVTDDFVETEPQIENSESADPLTQLLNNPMLLAAAGGGLLLFVALIGLIIKRRKAAVAESIAVPAISTVATTTSDFDDLESLADELASDVDDEEKAEQKASSVVDKGIADDVDSTSTMVLDSAEDAIMDEADVSEKTGEEETRDDIIAEADVYLAYGIYQQAEELLTQAIADNPERDDYRVKLAETHYASKNADAFVDIASDIKQRVDNDVSPAWKKVLGMGQDLCADNPLFQSAIVGGLASDSLYSDVPEMDFDLDLTHTGLDEERQDALRELPELKADAESVSPEDELEFDLSDVGAVEESTDIEEEFALDIDASELDIDIKDEVVAETDGIDLIDDIEADVYEKPLDLTDMDIGLDEVAGDASTATVDETIVEAAIVEDVDDVDIAVDVDSDADSETMTTDEDIAIDLTEEAELLDVDLNETADSEVVEETDAESTAIETAPVEAESIEVKPIEVKPGTSNDFGDDEDDFDLSKLDDVDEISTKLDLARAYLDMGDHEGTKGILEEVLADGNDEQKQEASELMAKMG